MNDILCEVRRGGRVESVHHGAVAVVEGGKTIYARGRIEEPVFLRSCAKPFQTFTVVACGAADAYGFDAGDLALISGSHGGDRENVRGVLSILRKAGLAPGALQCGSHAPSSGTALRALHRSGRPASVLHNNCSGKHAGMVAAARFLGVPLRTYLDPRHRLQRANLRHLARFAEVRESDIPIGIDGCSAPTFALPLRSIARAAATFCTAEGAARRVREAMMVNPKAVGRLSCEAMTAAPGRLLAKTGAEGVYLCGTVQRGVGIALKIEDGSHRPVLLFVAALCRKLGLLGKSDLARLDRMSDPVLRNHAGRRVGEMRVIV